MFQWGYGVGLLMVGGGGGQFLGRIGGIGLLPERIVVKRAVGQIPGGQTRIRRGIVFLRLGLFVAVRKTRLPGLRIGLL